MESIGYDIKVGYDGWNGSDTGKALSTVFSTYMTNGSLNDAKKYDRTGIYNNIPEFFVEDTLEYMEELRKNGYMFSVVVDEFGNLDARINDVPKLSIRLLDISDINAYNAMQDAGNNLTTKERAANKRATLTKVLKPEAKRRLLAATTEDAKKKLSFTEDDFEEKGFNRKLGRVYYNNSSYEIKNSVGSVKIKNKRQMQQVFTDEISMEDRLNILKVALGEVDTRMRRHSVSQGDKITSVYTLKDNPNALEIKRQDNVDYSSSTISNNKPSSIDAYVNYIKNVINSAKDNFVKNFNYDELISIGKQLSSEFDVTSISKKKSQLDDYDFLSDSSYIEKLQKNFVFDTYINNENIEIGLKEYMESKGKRFEYATLGDVIDANLLTCLNIPSDSKVYDSIRNYQISFNPPESFAETLYLAVEASEVGSYEEGFNPTRVIAMADSTEHSSAQKTLQYAIMKSGYDRAKLVGDEDDYNFVNFIRSTKSFNESNNIHLSDLKQLVAEDKHLLEQEQDEEERKLLEHRISTNEFKVRAMEQTLDALVKSGAITEKEDLKYITIGKTKKEEQVHFYDNLDSLIDVQMDNNGIIKWSAFRRIGSKEENAGPIIGITEPIINKSLTTHQYPKDLNGNIIEGAKRSDEYFAAYEKVSGYVGQIFIPDEFGLINTEFDIGDNNYLAPCYTGQILPDDLSAEKYTPMGERLRVSSFENNMHKMIRAEVSRQFTMDAIKNNKSKDVPPEVIRDNVVELATDFSTTTLNNLYSGDTFAMKIPTDFMTTDNISEETKKARCEQVKSTINLSKSYIAMAKTDSVKEYLANPDNPPAQLLQLTGGKSIRVLSYDDYYGRVSLLATGNNYNTQGIRLYLTNGATVNADGSVNPAPPVTDENGQEVLDNEGLRVCPGSPLEQIHEFRNRAHNTADRVQNALSQVQSAKAEYKDTVIASVPFFGWTQDDAYVVSKDMAERHIIHREDGTESGLQAGDKISDAGANKGVISLVVDRNWTEEEAKERGVYNEWRIFHDNPSLDAIAPVWSMANRNNTAVVMELINNYKDDLKLKVTDNITGETEILPCVSTETIYALEQTVDKKTTTYDDTDKKRKMSSQLLWVLTSKNLTNIGDAFYKNNKKEWSKFREYLIALGKDIAEDGMLLDKYTPREDVRNVLPNGNTIEEPLPEKRNRFMIDPTQLSDLEAQKAVSDQINVVNTELQQIATRESDGLLTDDDIKRREILTENLKDLWRQSKIIKSDVNRFYSAIGESGGQLLVPKDFGGKDNKLYYLLDDTQELDTVKEVVSDGSTREFYVVPILSKALRLDYQDESEERSYNDYTYLYNKMIDSVFSYYRTEQSISPDDKEETVERKRATMKEKYDQFVKQFTNLQSNLLKMTLNGSGSGKHAFVRDHLMSTNIEHSATAVFMPNPKLPIDTVEADLDIMRSLGLTRIDRKTGEEVIRESEKDSEILMWRDPALTTGALRAVKIIYNPAVHGISANPVLAKSIDGDFDGDTLGMAAITMADVNYNQEVYDAVHDEMREKLTPKKNLLDRTEQPDEKTGRFPLYFNLKMDIKIGEMRNIPFEPSEETLKVLNSARRNSPAAGTNLCTLKELKSFAEARANIAYRLSGASPDYICGSDGKALERVLMSRGINKEVKTNKDYVEAFIELRKNAIPGYPEPSAIKEYLNKESARFEHEAFIALNDYSRESFEMAGPAAFHNDFSSNEHYLQQVYNLWQTGVKLNPDESVKFETHMKYWGAKLSFIYDPKGGAAGTGCEWVAKDQFINSRARHMKGAIEQMDNISHIAYEPSKVQAGVRYPSVIYLRGTFQNKEYSMRFIGDEAEALFNRARNQQTATNATIGTVTGDQLLRFDVLSEEKRALCGDNGKPYVNFKLSNMTYAAQQDKEDTQQSIAGRVDTTSAGGSFSQIMISTLRDFNSEEGLNIAYHTYQGILQLKHNAEMARHVIGNVDLLINDLCKGKNPYKLSEKGNPQPFSSAEEMTDAFMRWHKETFKVTLNEAEIRSIAQEIFRCAPTVVDEISGYSYKDTSFDTYKNTMGCILDRLGYQIQNSTRPDEILRAACKRNENIFNSHQGGKYEASSIAKVINKPLTINQMTSTLASAYFEKPNEEYIPSTQIHAERTIEEDVADLMFANNSPQNIASPTTVIDFEHDNEPEPQTSVENESAHDEIEVEGFDDFMAAIGLSKEHSEQAGAESDFSESQEEIQLQDTKHVLSSNLYEQPEPITESENISDDTPSK